MTLSETATEGDRNESLVGTTIDGRYAVTKMIGTGGVGLVYSATQAPDEDGNTEVVVKVLAPNFAADTESSARFRREATRLSTLRHPNIVRMLDHGQQGSHAYLVMEYCKGELLSEYVGRNKALTLAQFVPIAAQLLKGIGHCHSRDMMVRDIKPANVMLVERKGRANFVKMLDFGLAKLIQDDQPITEEHVMGTVGYLSPEQIKGEPLDLRVDVYAVGVLFYYMLSGLMPFEGDGNAAIFYKTVNDPPRPLPEVLPEGSEVPEDLTALIHECLTKDREGRPADADAIVERLIDAVPASLFRLPRAEAGRPRTGSAPALDYSGRVDLPGLEIPPTSPVAIVPGGPVEGLVATPLGDGGTLPTSSHPIQLEQSSGNGKLIAAGAMLLGAALAVWFLTQSDSTPSDSPDPSKADVVAESGPSAAAMLDEAAAALEAGEFDAAQAKLDAAAKQSADAPESKARHATLERQVKIARLMATGAALEAEGRLRVAADTYRDAITLDGAYLPAREAIARLQAEEPTIPPPPPAADAKMASAAITSTPAGTVYIDGADSGPTPYNGNLAVGTHNIEIRARGFTSWSGTLVVTEEGTKPIAVALRKRRGRGGHSSSSPPATVPTPAPAAPTPTPTPEPAAKKPDPPAGKPSPFLPTKDAGKGSIFLPTKD